MQRIRRQQPKPRRSIFDSGDGIDFVRCRICGKHLRLITGTHLATHGTDRETYMQEYRLSPDKLCSKFFRRNHSSRRNYRPHSKQQWFIAIKIVYQRHGQVFAGYLQKHYPNLYREGIWLFGNWDAALRAAGFTPEKMRLWGLWDDARIMRQIHIMRKKSVPLNPAYVLKHHRKLFAAALRKYGAWSKALVAAGIEVPESPRDGRRGVLRALRDALEKHSENNIPPRLKLHAAYYFGSLAKAVAALKTDRRILAGWSKIKITTILNRMHTAKRKLGYAAARRDNTGLVSAAEAYFGSWGNALHAAGIDPNLYFRRKWRKRKTTAKRDYTG